jgi:two-component system, chemotaxis family, sensor kinase CheA
MMRSGAPMKIRTKLLIGLTVFLVLVVFLIGIGWFQFSAFQRVTDDLQQNYESSSLSYQIQRKIKDEAISIRNILVGANSSQKRSELNLLAAHREAVKQDIQRLEAVTLHPEQRVFVQDILGINLEFDAYLQEVTQLIEADKLDEAAHIVLTRGQQLQEEYFQVISRMTAAYETRMNESIEIMSSDMQELMLLGSIFSLIGLLIGIGVLFLNVWSIAARLKRVSGTMRDIASGRADLGTRIEHQSNDEIDDVIHSFNDLAKSLEEFVQKEQQLSQANRELSWIKANIAEVTTELSGQHDMNAISQAFLSRVVPLLDGCQAALYLRGDTDSCYRMQASYAWIEKPDSKQSFALGEGLVGQAAKEQKLIMIQDIPGDYMRVETAIGGAAPLHMYVVPVICDKVVLGVFEVASFKPIEASRLTMLNELVNNLGIILESAAGRIRLARLLEESQTMTEELQAQAEELQSQQEELRSANEVLETQTLALRRSEELLQSQQEELEQTNSELKEQALTLEKQNQRLERANKDLSQAKQELEEKAQELLLSTKYKSEFLANMSHELRTPLNSMLILSKLLADNPEGNLSSKQVEFASTVYMSGCDLLNIINDILDLAKVESGKMTVHPGETDIGELAGQLHKSFAPVAAEKNLEFRIEIKENAPKHLYTDGYRVEQVLKNLLSNAFKFTKQGEVVLEIGKDNRGTDHSSCYFSVRDTGIGIPEDKHALIFQAFQQADGTTSRQYGGTGLGLSICKEISLLLGGDISLESEEGSGSVFTFYVGNYPFEDHKGSRDELYMVDDSDIEHVPNIVGKENAAIDQAEARPSSDKTKVQGNDDTTSHIKRLLIVDDHLPERNRLIEIIGDMDIIITAVSSGMEALEELKVGSYDFMLLDLGIHDMAGIELLERMKERRLGEGTRIFIYTGLDLAEAEEIELRRYTSSIIIKDEHSPERLKGELKVYLQADAAGPGGLPAEGVTGRSFMQELEGKVVLLIDDDVRNVFSLSNILEMQGMEVLYAGNGADGLQVLGEHPDIDVVLMDIMMPVMDGYEAMRQIRENPDWQGLPIIALTAKAMAEDRARCMEAGASDYIVKPVDAEQLLSLIKVWTLG